MTTLFENRCEILFTVYNEHLLDPRFADFIKPGNIGIFLAYAHVKGLVGTLSEQAKLEINMTFAFLLLFTGHQTDQGFGTLKEILDK